MKADSILTFGRYTGRTIEEVWTGTIPLKENNVLKDYIIELCSFLLDDSLCPQKTPASNFDLTTCSNELLFINQSHSYRKVKFENNKIVLEAEDNKIPLAFFKILSSVLSNSFIGRQRFYTRNQMKPDGQYSKNSIHFHFLQADAQYIKWCIENIKRFYVEPNDLESLKLKSCQHFSHFNLSKMSEDVFSCESIFKELEYILPDQTVLLNKEKFNDANVSKQSTQFYNYQDEKSSTYCTSCCDSPCMCSDREQSSSVYDY